MHGQAPPHTHTSTENSIFSPLFAAWYPKVSFCTRMSRACFAQCGKQKSNGWTLLECRAVVVVVVFNIADVMFCSICNFETQSSAHSSASGCFCTDCFVSLSQFSNLPFIKRWHFNDFWRCFVGTRGRCRVKEHWLLDATAHLQMLRYATWWTFWYWRLKFMTGSACLVVVLCAFVTFPWHVSESHSYCFWRSCQTKYDDKKYFIQDERQITHRQPQLKLLYCFFATWGRQRSNKTVRVN